MDKFIRADRHHPAELKFPTADKGLRLPADAAAKFPHLNSNPALFFIRAMNPERYLGQRALSH